MENRKLLKEHCIDSVYDVILTIILYFALVYSYWPRNFSGCSALYIFKYYALRFLSVFAIIAYWGVLIGCCRRCVMGLIDIRNMQEVTDELTVCYFTYKKFNVSSKKGYICIYPKQFSRCNIIDVNIGALKCLYLDERICTVGELNKMIEQMKKKNGKRYTYTAYKHSKIITSITCRTDHP